jgi:hypothetical protein
LRERHTGIAAWIHHPKSGRTEESKFVDLAPTDKADEAGVYSDALRYATDNPRVSNIALTGPYGSGKSSIIKSFLKNYRRPVLQISLAAFLPEAESTGGEVSKQEIERSILQQMLYGADANKLPLSRFKRIKSPGRWSGFISLYIALGLISCWHLINKREEIVSGQYFKPFTIDNWLNLVCFTIGGTFVWLVLHYFYATSFGFSLKSISLKDIELAPEVVSQESILNRHLDEIIYFFQSTKYDLVVIEDLDRFNNPEIFVTLREINSLVNANSGVKRTVRFLYALRDDMFMNTDRTKFFEFIIPVIPIINSSNSIDKVLEQGKRLSLDTRLDGQFLREVSRYLDDLRLIQNIFNEYAIYAANLDAAREGVLNANKLLAVLIYKNVFPSDFENLHRGKGNLAQILDSRNEYIARAEAKCKADISSLEDQIETGERQLPTDIAELRRIYAMALLEKIPENVSYISGDGNKYVSTRELAKSNEFEQILESREIVCKYFNNHVQRQGIAGFQAEVNSDKSFQQRKSEIEKKALQFKDDAAKIIRELRLKLSTLRVTKFNEIIRQNASGVEDLFEAFDDNAELARFLVFEGFLDDTYYQYTSLFHSGRMSPNDNRFLIQIRGFITPEPDFQVDNPKEIVAAMRDDDFRQSYVLNVKIVDCLLGDRSAYVEQSTKLFEFIASDFKKCEAFFAAYYTTGAEVSALLSGLFGSWPGFISATLASVANLTHVARILAHLPARELATLPETYPDISEFVSLNLPQILALGVDFEPERLKLLGIEATDLAGIEGYPGIVSLLFDEGLYRLSVSNVDFIFRFILGGEDWEDLHKHHYTSILRAGHASLVERINQNFSAYLEDILLTLEENTEESVAAILSIIGHDEIETESLREFLKEQSELVPILDQAPIRLHAMLFEIEKIAPTWENCLAFLSSKGCDLNILTDYLNKKHAVAALSRRQVSNSEQALPLREFLIENDALNDEAYASYVRALPGTFKKFPKNVSSEKLRIVIDQKKVSFSSANLFSLGEDRDLQILFVERNVDSYLEIESECDLDDDFREKLLSSPIRDDHKLRIIQAMDLDLLADMPSRAAIVGPILLRTGAEIGELSAESLRAIILNSKPIAVQISLFNKAQHKLDDQQVREVLRSLPDPFSDIKPGWRTPRIGGTDINLEFVTWLKTRGFISSWKRGLFDDDIRINLYRR